VLNPADFIITKKRKKYRFAVFANSSLCFETNEWDKSWQPDIVEIGAGTGLFSAIQAGASSKNFVAVDVKADRLQKGALYGAKQQLPNVRFLRARADQVSELLQPHSLEAVWITFPDPFPKKRAAKHRLTHPRYLRLYASLLTPGGSLLFKTDAKDLFEWSLEQLVEEGWGLRELSFDLHESSLNDNYKVMTTYERRFHDDGLPVCFVRASCPKA
jgi:tRNA (guanine-N7-)-methyltransferase